MVSINQFEKNVGISFSYVKKDLMSVNDMVSDLHEKIQHLSLNQAMLLEKVMKLEQSTAKKATKKVVKKIAKKKAVAKKIVVKKVIAKKPIKKVVKETTTYN